MISSNYTVDVLIEAWMVIEKQRPGLQLTVLCLLLVVQGVRNMIWTNNQYFSLVCVQLLEVGGHPVLNSSGYC